MANENVTDENNNLPKRCAKFGLFRIDLMILIQNIDFEAVFSGLFDGCGNVVCSLHSRVPDPLAPYIEPLSQSIILLMLQFKFFDCLQSIQCGNSKRQKSDIFGCAFVFTKSGILYTVSATSSRIQWQFPLSHICKSRMDLSTLVHAYACQDMEKSYFLAPEIWAIVIARCINTQTHTYTYTVPADIQRQLHDFQYFFPLCLLPHLPSFTSSSLYNRLLHTLLHDLVFHTPATFSL